MKPRYREPLSRRFLDNPRTAAAIDAIGDWASVEWHRASGGEGYPMMDDRPLGPGTKTPPGPARVLTLQSNHDLVSRAIDGCPELRRMLMHKHPLLGPFARNRDYDSYDRLSEFSDELCMGIDEFVLMCQERERSLIERVRALQQGPRRGNRE